MARLERVIVRDDVSHSLINSIMRNINSVLLSMFHSSKQGELGLPGPAGVDGEKVIIRSTHSEEFNFLK